MMSNLYYNRWEVNWFSKVTINAPLEVPLFGYGWIYKILSSQNPNKRQYEVTMGNFLTCICLDFVTMTFNSLSRWRKWVPCKHMYYVLQHVMFCGEFEDFIHFPTWSCDEVLHLLVHHVTFMYVGIHFWIVIKNKYNEHYQF
jgi:hypothetical protein